MDGKLSEPLDGVPAVDAVEQGGLLDVALDPEFGDNRLVYLSYAEKRATAATARPSRAAGSASAGSRTCR